jgi:hypothetical protein
MVGQLEVMFISNTAGRIGLWFLIRCWCGPVIINKKSKEKVKKRKSASNVINHILK